MTTTIRRRASGIVLGLLCVLGAVAAPAQELSLPKGAERTFHTVQDPGRYALPVGPWAGGAIPVKRVEGRVEVASWRVPLSGATAFQLIQPLRDALTAAGFEIVLDCAGRRCGGFDFRFDTLVLPAPEMFVSLDDYHFVSAVSDAGAVSLLASPGPRDGYIQIIRAGTDLHAEVKASAAPVPRREAEVEAPLAADAAPSDVVATLEAEGHVVLPDVAFASGSTALGEGAVASLDTLAAALVARPDRRVMIVGHTDATGSLQANRAISLKRAQAAVAYLRKRGVPRGQLSAEGAGYMAPRATNLTEVGREANRRVEAVLTSTE
ncbi:OmpA family protein [Sagittula salina]|uniref:OmpA family protein n=1 Tax=Sagittula salina TaxID=2820268 RepID=A0A940MP73_9RHOB|nr:OmpA family protein [Sagittula salina]MBP0485096.1 OmpA family protein [Sagittula salina]